MIANDWKKVEALLSEVLELPPADRSEFLARSCAGDNGIRAEVESLLACELDAAEFLKVPALSFSEGLIDSEETDELAGRQIGRYRIVRELGRGGMGAVYLATRADQQYEKQVAIKLVKRGLDTEDIRRRFLHERQILASLDHPNIARLIDGGTTEDGLPYFVMDYVEGAPITHYCDEHQLSIRERLEMFRTVCSAVHYAHQNLVIHRDIKPGNVSVTEEGTPKLLDFGIAKLLDTETAEQSEHTVTILGVMTPDYASPEQVRGEQVTTASDVYSLGVLLYELLSGHRPYRITSRRPDEIARMICEVEPEKPSTAARATAFRVPTSVGFFRHKKGPTKVGSLNTSNPKSLRGDLDNIVLMAMRKEPARRYASVEQFSEDIRRHVEGRPVIARKDTFDYRAGKYVRRHRLGVVAAAVVALTLIGGIITTAWQARVARAERDRARAQQSKAERINTFLQRMLSFSNQGVTSVWPVPQARDVTVNQMLDQITPQVEKELADQPDVRAQVLRTIGSTYASQGQYKAAEKNFRAALEAQRAFYGEDNREVADTMLELGVLSYRQQNYDEAGQLLERARTVYAKQREMHSPEYRAAKAALASDYLAAVKLLQVDASVAMPLFNEALQIAATGNLQGEERGVLAGVKSDTGAGILYTGDIGKAEALLREALNDWHQIPGRPRWEQGANLTMLGIAELRQSRLDEAERYLREGEQLYRQTLGDNNYYLAMNLSAQGDVLFQKNDLKAAEERAKAALAMIREFSPDNKFAWTTPMRTLGDVLTKAGRAREAEEYLRQALAICEEQPTKNYSLIASTKLKLSQSLVAQNRLPEAEKMAREAYDEVKQNLGLQHPALKTTAANLVKIYEKEGKSDLAEKLK